MRLSRILYGVDSPLLPNKTGRIRAQQEFEINVNDLADQVVEQQGITKANAREFIDALMSASVDAAAKGEEIALPGFGKFKLTNRAARVGRNPSTGATIKIAASTKLSFVPAKALKDALNPASTKKATKAKK
ncbi:MAG: family DNA-binding protein [Rhodospirillales bacterium]|nr:family DNA-binding protein [Rhodospirillales bacterium]